MTKPSALQRFIALVTRRPIWFVALTALVTLLAGWSLPRLSFKTTVYDLIIEDLPEAAQYRDFQQLFGSDEIIRLVVRAEDVLAPATFAKVIRLSEKAGEISGVRRILSLPEIKKSVDRDNSWDMEKFAQILAPVDLFKRNLISEDHRTTIITLVLQLSADRTAVIQDVEHLIRREGKQLALYQIGMPLVSQALADYSRQDFLHLTPFTLLVIALLLLVLYRNPHCLILPLACVLLTIVWTFGLMAFLSISISMLTIIVPVFIIAVGTAYCLHLCSEYLTRVAENSDARGACRDTFGRLALPVTLAVLTTMFGIGSLAVNRITAIREFAAFTCFGMACLLVIVFTFFPAVLSLLPAPSRPLRRPAALDRLFDQLLERIVSVNLKHQKTCLLVIGLVALVCLAGMFMVRVETNPLSFFKTRTPVSRHFHDIYRDMSGSFPMNVVISAKFEDYYEEPSNVAEIQRLQTYLESLPGVDKTLSVVNYLKLVNYVAGQYKAESYTLPEDPYEMRMLFNSFKILLGNDFLKTFLSPDYSQVNILMLTHIASSRAFMDTKARIMARSREMFGHDLHCEVTGLGTVIAASSHLLTVGQIKSLSLSLGLIFAVMVALFLSSKVGLIAVVPNIFPILVNFGLMGLLNIPLSTATALIASIAIGLAVDDTIHYLVRYNTEFKKDLDKDRAMRATVLSVGRPIIFTSCTISLGFAVLLFSHFQPTAIFGLLMVITMVSALIGDLLLLPVLMMHVELVTAWDLLKLIPTLGGIPPGLVHELNQPLNAIKVGSEFLKMMLKKVDTVRSDQLLAVASEISRQVNRASRLIERIGEAGKTPGFNKAALQINQPIVSTVDILENQLKLDNIQFKLDLADALPPIHGHFHSLNQVFYNVINNAWEAMNNQAKDHGTDKPRLITIRTFMEKERVLATIADTGPGIPDHFLDRIFEPFFTTKVPSQGKGLGLSISNEIVRDCGGRVAIQSTPGKGTVVTLSFPAIVG